MKKLYLIGNAHLDPVWLWRWQDGYSEVLATFRSALDRMKEDPAFKFTSACAVYYQWVEKTDPKMFDEIRERVKEGRWNITGGWFLQPDCNIPSGESFARHILIAQRYFKEKFDLTVKTGYNVDSFGHNASIPKILSAGGMENYVYMRPNKHEKPQNFELFKWESDDGSAVTAYRIPESYAITELNLPILDRIADSIQSDGVPRMAFYGVGNHGGGPTARLLDLLHEKNYPDSTFGTPDEYFNSVDKNALPTVRGELQHHARGCYSANSYVKTMNRRCEEALLSAERFCVLANKLVSFPYPRKALRKAWKNLLFNQFHDILAGCSIESAYTDASYLFGEAMSIAEQAINASLQTIATQIDTGAASETGTKKSEDMTHWLVWEHDVLGSPVVIFNPHAFPVRDAVSLRIYATEITDESGCEVPFQKIRGEQTNCGKDLYNVTFPVEIPALGYRVYRAFSTKSGKVCFDNVYADDHTLENSRLRVEFDAGSGEICRIYDKAKQISLISAPCRTILTDERHCDTWAHNQFDLGPECAVFQNADFKVMEIGPACATLRVTAYCGDSVITRFYTLVADSDEIRVNGETELREKHKALKITFPADTDVTCEIPYGTVNRNLCNGEEPFGKWFASGLIGIANTNKYSYDSTDREIRMTLSRSAIYADHYGFEYRDDSCRFMERGPQSFAYSIFPYVSVSDANRRAAVLNSPLRAINASFHHGPLSERYEGFTCDADNVSVTAIKMAEDRDGEVIIRLLELEGQAAMVNMELFGKAIKSEVSPRAIKTVNEQEETLNLMEWEENP